MGLAQRSITSVVWRSVANWVSWVALFVRGVLLARWLPVDVFGVYAFANSIVAMLGIVAEFGMAGAFLHRAPETQDEGHTAAVHFTLRFLIAMVFVVLLVPGVFIFSSGSLQTALLVLVATTAVGQLLQTPQRILARRVVHRRLALIQLGDAVLGTLLVLGLAWRGETLWALLASGIFGVVFKFFALYVWKPVWRPRLVWSPPVMRYFLGFGSRNVLAGFLHRALDRVDDLWVGFYLGETFLGFYSKAYNFATYPRRVLALPVNSVAGGAYAELKTDRLRLSQTFFRVNALLIRSGFFMGGLLALVAPEFIHFVLGEKWMPMLDAFRLMLVFTLFDPIKTTIGHLFVAVGRPERLVKIRLAQFAVMVICLYLLGSFWGIAGVALAVDIMLVFGIGLLLLYVRKHVDISIRRLLLIPFLALLAGMALARGALFIPGVLGSDWRTAGVKGVLFVIVYVSVLILLERQHIQIIIAGLKRLSLLPAFWQKTSDA